MATAKQKAWRKEFARRFGGKGKKKRSRSGGSTMAKKKKGGGSSRSWMPKMGGVKTIIDKGAKGLGYATLITAGLNMVGQGQIAANPIVQYGAAWMGGGLEGVGAQLLVGGVSTGAGTSSGVKLHG